MKTKHILTAMVLPTLLAACTADEIVENNNNAILKNRAQVEAVTFTTEGVQSRLAYENGAWKWEDTDKFLLLNADNGDKDNDAEYPGYFFAAGAPTTGYEYAKGEDGVYTTSASVMTEGLYWGYAPSFNKTYKGYVEYNLATAQDQDYYKSAEAQAFITPLYEIVAGENFNNKLPLEMINWYSTLEMPLTNSTKEDITLKQIVLTNTSTDYPFVVKGLVNTSAMDSFVMAYDGEKWAPKKQFDANEAEIKLDYDYAKGVNELISGNADFTGMRKTYLTTKNANSVTSPTIVLNLDEVVLEAGETETFYMLIPATEGKISCEITIIADEGVIKIDKAADSNKLKNTQIYHNGTKHAFGTITSGKNKGEARAYNITSGKFEDMTGAYYVASYEDMMNHIETVNGTFFAYNIGEWTLDAEMMEAIEESDAYVVFMNPVEIEGTSVASRSTETEGLKLTKVSFAKGATVLKNTKVTFASEGGEYEFEIGDEAYDEEAEALVNNAAVNGLTVEEGAEVVLARGVIYGDVVNEGVLTIKAAVEETSTLPVVVDAREAKITNKGTLTLAKETVNSITLKGGELKYDVYKSNTEWEVSNKNVTFALAANAKISVAKGVTMANEIAHSAGWRTLKDNGTTKHAVSIENNGEIVLTGTSTYGSMYIYGTLTNNGEILSESHSLINMNSVVNNENAMIKVLQFVNYGSMTNNGQLRIENESNHGNSNWGVITTGADSKTYINNNQNPMSATLTGVVGRINNTAEGIVSVTNSIAQTVFYLVNDANETDIANVKFAARGINTLRVEGTLTLNKSFDEVEGFAKTDLATLTTMEVSNGSKIKVYDNDVRVAVTNVIFEGSADIVGVQQSESQLTFDNGVAITLTNKAMKSADAATTDPYKLTVEDVKLLVGTSKQATISHKNQKTTIASPVYKTTVQNIVDATFFTETTLTVQAN